MNTTPKPIIAVHGGAGTISRESMTPEKEVKYKSALREAVLKGSQILEKGGSAIEAVEAAVIVLEDCPLFNAGKGSVFTNKGTHEMDAAIMCGKTLEAGAVACVEGVKNPIRLAKLVMKKSGHVFLCGPDAVKFARLYELPIMPPDYFFDQFRYEQWMEAKKTNQATLDHSAEDEEGIILKDKKFGTVGAVALDAEGNLAAATSTGGLTNKKFGRIGDSPIIGAGTYANNASCAVSCTGYGEFFIRAVVAHDIACLMEYAGMSLKEAASKVVLDKLVKMNASGGVIAVDKYGNVDLCFNSEGMYRAYKRVGEKEFVAIYRD
ncbi:MAG: isoaspartyl peptidase/L-asparaginase [Cytophagales bacterium]|nr:isoaspartyl peptidase/L-asparaginase [Cytophagales bacterium]MDW8384626.1 isoaspartyl peptidase/L-asparaginase [Flammeovirgaceae bacterium]